MRFTVSAILFSLSKAARLHVFDEYGSSNGDNDNFIVQRVQSQEECDMIHGKDTGFIFD